MKSSIILFALLTLVVGCDAIDALKATKEMKTATNSMNNKMDATNVGIQDTAEKLHKQTLLFATDSMVTDKNSKNLEPIALGMIAGGKAFGEEATPKEIIEYTKLLLKEIKTVKLDESLLTDAAAVKAFDHEKMVKFNQILTIAGFCPQEKVIEIIKDQINGNGGEYRKIAYIFLMARVKYLGAYIQESYLAEEVDTIDGMKEMIQYLSQVDFILKKKAFAANVKMNITGFIALDPIVAALYDENGKMEDSWNAPKLWKKTLKRFDQDLKDGNVIEGTSTEYDETQAEIAKLKADVQAYLDSWK